MIDSQSGASPSIPKLNILALPRLTTILFALLVGTILGVVALAVLPGSQVWWVPMVIAFTVLSLRDFLLAPDRWMHQYELTARADENTLTIENSLLSLSPDPSIFVTVVTTDRNVPGGVMGTVRRHFWGLTQTMAARIAAGLRSSEERRKKVSQAALARTLGTFLNQDVQLIELSNSLLRIQLLIGLVYVCIGAILTSFLGRFGPEIFSPEFWRSLAASPSLSFSGFPAPDLSSTLHLLTKQNPTAAAQLADPTLAAAVSTRAVYSMIASILPIFLCVLILYGVHFAQLLRGSVLYADARAAMLMGDARVIVDMMHISPIWGLSSRDPVGFRRGIALVRERIGDFILKIPLRILGRASSLTFTGRALCLERPELVIDSAKSIAIATGLTALMLELVQRGFQGIWFGAPSQSIAPFIYYVPPFIIFAIWLIPQLVQQSGRPLPRTIAELVLVFTAIRLVPNVVDLLVAGIYSLGALPRSGDPFAGWLFRAMFGSGGDLLSALPIPESIWTGFVNQNVVYPFVYSVLLMAPALIVLLWIEAKLSQYVLTWYRPERRVLRVLYGISGVFTVVLGLGIIPLINHLISPARHPAWSGVEIGGIIMALMTLVSGVSALWFMGRRLARQCPRCRADILGEYHLGRVCAACGQQLHSWLIADY
jgi:hypothetical protein